MAPMTPATAFEIPPDPDEGVAVAEAPDEVELVEAQIPVLLPHFWHQVA